MKGRPGVAPATAGGHRGGPSASSCLHPARPFNDETAMLEMVGMPEESPGMDEPVRIDLDPEVALRALMKVDPDAPPATLRGDAPVVESEPLKDQGDPLDDNRG
jgi:hypothetical protein